jgi:predicted MPP superfamily phosphohydrolase
MLWFVALALAVIIWATLIERFLFTIKRESIAVLPSNSASITILHISDIHLAPWQKAKMRWLAKLAKTVQPDMVIDTGDNLGHRDAVSPALVSLQGLKGPGVFVNGSNDIYAPVITNPFSYLLHPSKRHRDNNPKNRLDVERLNAGFRKLGWTELNNSASTIKINGLTLGFIGTDDPHEGRADLEKLSVAAKKIGKADLIIGVTHAPYLEVIDALAELDAELIFAGHTHGGQVCWPFSGRALVTNCDLPAKYARGAHQLERAGKSFWLNVCAGLGNSIFAPVRLACRPEVRVITLVAKN